MSVSAISGITGVSGGQNVRDLNEFDALLRAQKQAHQKRQDDLMQAFKDKLEQQQAQPRNNTPQKSSPKKDMPKIDDGALMKKAQQNVATNMGNKDGILDDDEQKFVVPEFQKLKAEAESAQKGGGGNALASYTPATSMATASQ